MTKKIICTSIFLLFFQYVSMATHAVGVDLTYTCMGSNQYKIRVAFYRDCIGSSSANPTQNQKTIKVTLSPDASCSGADINLTLDKLNGTGQEVSPYCPSSPSTCTDKNSSLNGIKEYVYEGVVTLPATCKKWKISYYVIARNSAITTIPLVNGETQSMYVDAYIDNTAGVCNNSPSFTNKPVPFACVGQKYCFNHGAIDPDGDSLVYELVPPKHQPYDANNTPTGPPVDVIYYAPHSATQPVLSNPPVTIDPGTGDICMSPTQQEVSVMAVRVYEYRNGVLIGSVVRDMQINIINCSNNNPSLSGINGSSTRFDTTVCAGSSFCFTIHAADADSNQSLKLLWNNGIPGATFTTSGGSRPVGTFCWTPGKNDIGNVSHCFTVQVTDDNCPLLGSQTYSYCIKVTGPLLDLGPDLLTCVGPVVLDAGGQSNYTYNWSTGETTKSIQVNSEGNYWVEVKDGTGCSARDTIHIAFGTLKVNVGADITACSGDSVVLDAGGSSGYTYDWSTGETTKTIIVKKEGVYYVNVNGGGGCKGSDTISVAMEPKPSIKVDPAAASICLGDSIQLLASGGIYYFWSPSSSLSGANIDNPFASPTATTTYTVISTSAKGCTNTSIAKITVNSPPVLNVTSNNPSFCRDGSTTLTASGANTFTWYNGTGLNTTTGAVVIASPTSTITYTVTGSNGNSTCGSNTSTILVTVHPLPAASIVADSVICLKANMQFKASGAGAGGSYSWNPATGLSSKSIPDPVFTPASAGLQSYTVTIKTAHGCNDSAHIKITVLDPVPALNIGADVTICNTPVQLSASGTGDTYSWSPPIHLNNPNLANPIANPPATTTYTVSTGSNCGFQQTTAVVKVTVQCPIQVPNVFTPNGDDKNNTLVIDGLDLYPHSRLVVYNRWGNKIYESQNYMNDWNGNGATDGTYYYILSVSDGRSLPGFVTILHGK